MKLAAAGFTGGTDRQADELMQTCGEEGGQIKGAQLTEGRGRHNESQAIEVKWHLCSEDQPVSLWRPQQKADIKHDYMHETNA